MDVFYAIGQQGPAVAVVGALHLGQHWLAIAVLLEASVLGLVWKLAMLPWCGSVRPHHHTGPLTVRTSGMPSAHTACMVLFVCVLVSTGASEWVLLAAAALGMLTISQRIVFGYHSVLQVLVGVCVGLLDAWLWLQVCGFPH